MTLNQVKNLKRGDPIRYLDGLFIVTKIDVNAIGQKHFQCLLMLPTGRRESWSFIRSLPGIPIRKDSSYADRSFRFHESMLIMSGFKL